MNPGDACKILKTAVGELAKAKAGVDPDDVVAAADRVAKRADLAGRRRAAAKACRLG